MLQKAQELQVVELQPHIPGLKSKGPTWEERGVMGKDLGSGA